MDKKSTLILCLHFMARELCCLGIARKASAGEGGRRARKPSAPCSQPSLASMFSLCLVIVLILGLSSSFSFFIKDNQVSDPWVLSIPPLCCHYSCKINLPIFLKWAFLFFDNVTFIWKVSFPYFLYFSFILKKVLVCFCLLCPFVIVLSFFKIELLRPSLTRQVLSRWVMALTVLSFCTCVLPYCVFDWFTSVVFFLFSCCWMMVVTFYPTHTPLLSDGSFQALFVKAFSFFAGMEVGLLLGIKLRAATVLQLCLQ